MHNCEKFGRKIAGFSKNGSEINRKKIAKHICNPRKVSKPIQDLKPDLKISEEDPEPTFDFEKMRPGTFSYPTLYKVVKTKASLGKWYTPVTYIFQMDSLYYHIRKNGVSSENRYDIFSLIHQYI